MGMANRRTLLLREICMSALKVVTGARHFPSSNGHGQYIAMIDISGISGASQFSNLAFAVSQSLGTTRLDHPNACSSVRPERLFAAALARSNWITISSYTVSNARRTAV
jgi:hypothetical protein